MTLLAYPTHSPRAPAWGQAPLAIAAGLFFAGRGCTMSASEPAALDTTWLPVISEEPCPDPQGGAFLLLAL
jgi:hypothetical protein